MKFVKFLCLLLSAYCPLSFATVWYVHSDSAMNNIDAALDSCAQNDTVLVGPGTYYENIWWPATKGICLISEYGPDTTIIDGRTIYRTIYIPPDGVDSTGQINGFTIKRGSITSGSGAGIYCLRDGFTISGNIITDNYASGGGGGIGSVYPYGGAALIIDNIITKNHANRGAGIYVGGDIGPVTITNNTLSGNSAFEGGGLCLEWGAMAILHDNVFMNDTANKGGAIFAYGNALITNTDFIENVAGIYLTTPSHFALDSCDLINNQGDALNLADNSSAVLHYCNIFGNTGYGVNNESPNIVDAEYNWWGDWTGPYHPDSNPGGLGDWVSDNVDFVPWLDEPVGINEQPSVIPTQEEQKFSATIFNGPLPLPRDKQYGIFDITGRRIHTLNPAPGIYFIEVDGEIQQKIVKTK